MKNEEKLLLVLGVLIVLSLYQKPFSVYGSTYQFQPTDDARVYEPRPDDNIGFAGDVEVSGKTDSLEYSYLKFDLSPLPKEQEILNAELHLYNYGGSGSGNIGVWNCSDQVWTEGEITWNNMPNVNWMESTIQSDSCVPNCWQVWNVTEIIKSYYENGYQNATFRLAFTTTSEDFLYTFWASKDGEVIETFPEEQPQLYITPTIPSPQSLNMDQLLLAFNNLFNDIKDILWGLFGWS